MAAGYYDGFFETGLNPWDVAAGSLIITEAGGLIGNFTGEADYLYQREVVAGNPKVYGQLVQILTPYTRVIEATPRRPGSGRRPRAAQADATQAFVAAAALDAQAEPADPAAATRKAAVRIRKRRGRRRTA